MQIRMAKAALAFSIFCAIGAATAAQANDNGAGQFISRLGEQTISYLMDRDASRRMREERLRGLLRDGFAVQAIGRFVLGKYRRTASPETVDAFIEVFEDYIVRTYASRFSSYSGQTFDVRKILKTANAKDTMVMTHIAGKNSREPLRVDFQVRNRKGTYKIIDIRVEGVSMVLAQRDEFTAFIAKNGGDVRVLINALRKRTDLAAQQRAR